MIERDVKQAVKLLEMSLSGLMSAESALKRWKAHIPQKVGRSQVAYSSCPGVMIFLCIFYQNNNVLPGMFSSGHV